MFSSGHQRGKKLKTHQESLKIYLGRFENINIYIHNFSEIRQTQHITIINEKCCSVWSDMPEYENLAFQTQEEEDGSSNWVLLIHRLCLGAFHGHFSLRTLKAMNTMPYLVKYLWPRCLPGVNATANNKFILLKTTKSQCGFIWYAKKLSGAHVSTSSFLSCEGQWHSMGACLEAQLQKWAPLTQPWHSFQGPRLPSLTSWSQ